jgi:hypothetical protein
MPACFNLIILVIIIIPMATIASVKQPISGFNSELYYFFLFTGDARQGPRLIDRSHRSDVWIHPLRSRRKLPFPLFSRRVPVEPVYGGRWSYGADPPMAAEQTASFLAPIRIR